MKKERKKEFIGLLGLMQGFAVADMTPTSMHT
jgi:hypothetical protein